MLIEDEKLNVVYLRNQMTFWRHLYSVNNHVKYWTRIIDIFFNIGATTSLRKVCWSVQPLISPFFLNTTYNHVR